MEPNNYVAYSFPPHEVSPAEKSKKSWGLQGANAVWWSNNSYAPSMFYNDRDTYETYLKYAFGEMDDDTYKPALGINAKNKENSFVGSIRWRAKNFATKRIQATVSRIFGRQYDPVATAIDPTSVNRRESYKASLQMWSEQQSWLMEKAQMLGVQEGMQGVDMSSIPATDEALEIMMQDYKLASEIVYENAINFHLKRLNFAQDIKEKYDQYLVMLPAAGVWCGLDGSNMPVVKALNPSRIIAPDTEFNNYKRIPFAGYVDEFTVAEFRNMATDLTKEEVDRAVKMYAKKGGNYHRLVYNKDYPWTYRDVDTLTILHFEISTVDEYVFLSKTDKYGNKRFIQKGHDYYRGKDDEFKSKYRESRSLVRYPKKTVYGGYWIVGSDVVFNYGEKNYLSGDLGYKLRSSNAISGYSTCMVKQMIPSLDMLETYDKKIQQLVASILPNGIKIDLFALRKASFNFRGKEMQTGDLIDMFLQRGILVTDTSESGAGDARKPLELFNTDTTSKLVNLLAMMNAELERLDEIIGFNAVSSGETISPETGARVAQQMDLATDVNLDHLFRADRDLCAAVYDAILKLHRESIKTNTQFYISALGEEAVLRMLSGYSTDQLGIDIEARPTRDEWINFYNEISDMVRAGTIMPQDRVALRRFTSLKQAETYLKVVTEKRARDKQNEQLQLVQANAQAQKISNDSAVQGKIIIEQEKEKNQQQQRLYEDYRKDKDHAQKMEQIREQQKLMNAGKIAETMIESETAIKVAESRPSPSK